MRAVSKRSRKERRAAATPAVLTQPLVAPVPAANRALISAVLLALVLVVFGRSATHDFINFDDPVYVTENPMVQGGLTSSTIRWAFTAVHDGPYWEPLTWLSLEADVSLWGLQAGPPLAENVILHGLAAVFLFLALARATAAPWRSAIVSALWAVHPLRVESVAWVAERKDVLSTCLAMLTILLFVRYTETKSAGRYAAVLVVFIAAAMAKPIVITIPVLLLLIDWWPLQRAEKVSRLILEQLPLAFVAAAVLVLTFVGQHAALAPLSPATRIANALTNYATYLVKLAVPVQLSILYPLPYHVDGGAVVLSILVLAAISSAAWFWRRSNPSLAFGWAWYLVALVPVAGFVQAGPQKLADRFTYIPSVGIFVAVVWLIAQLIPATARRGGFVAATIATLLYASAAFAYVGEWRNSETIFRHALESTDENVVAELKLADVLVDSGRMDEANEHYERALRLSNSSVTALAEYGRALFVEKRYAEAADSLQRAVSERPDLPDAQETLGLALVQTGRSDEGLQHLRAALAYDRGRRRATIESEIASAVRNAPSPAGTHNNRGADLAKKGEDQAAEAEYREALRLDPKLFDAHMNLAALLSRHDRNAEAIAEVEEAAKLREGSVEPKVYLAILFAQANRRPEAAAMAEEAMRTDAKASNEYFTSALHLPPASDNLARFVATMRR